MAKDAADRFSDFVRPLHQYQRKDFLPLPRGQSVRLEYPWTSGARSETGIHTKELAFSSSYYY
ncbi:MAG: hypothetical protein ACJ0BN_15245 [Limisphaerales bacterium]|nr:hypothetical protein [Verrucomicrobiae bacterium]RZO72891.1 MAG: hypothetical protein EVA71_04265 [Limisphaerales bacterium]